MRDNPNLDPELDEEIDYYGEKSANTFHSFDHVAKVADWAAKLSWVFLLFAMLAGGTNLFSYFATLGSATFQPNSFAIIANIIHILSSIVSYLFYFIGLQAISAILLLLLDIEDNTRERTS